MNLGKKIGEKFSDLSGRENHDYVDGIHCEVTNCVYHDEKCKCSADGISVGPTFAASGTDTVCSTFKPKNH